MKEKKRNICIDQDGIRHSPVSMWQELPQIMVRPKKREYTYRTTLMDGTAVPYRVFENGWSIADIP